MNLSNRCARVAMVVGGIFVSGLCAGAALAQAPTSPAAAGAKPEPREYAAKPAIKKLDWPKDAVRGSKAMVVSDNKQSFELTRSCRCIEIRTFATDE